MYVLTPAPTLPVDRRTALRRLLLRTVQSAYGTIAFRNAILGGKLVTLRSAGRGGIGTKDSP